MKQKSIKKKLTGFQADASRCHICRENGLLYQHTNRRWAYPLFDKNLECKSGVLAIAEAPNFDDTFDSKKGYLSYDIETDPTGNFFRELLESVGLTVKDVIITNSVLCLPAMKGEDYPVSTQQENNCSPWIQRLIDEVNPRVVVTVGAQALKAVRRIENHQLMLKRSAGKLHNWYGRKLLPLYHTSDRGRANRAADIQLRDISVLKRVLRSTTEKKLAEQFQKTERSMPKKLPKGPNINSKSFKIFVEQQELFRKALCDYDKSVWLLRLRGNFEKDVPSNWFISFVPGSWGIWKETGYGVHFDFMYARPKGDLPERFRLAIGVEKPIKDSFKQKFKDEVLLKIDKEGVNKEGLVLKAKNYAKLVETEFIPFNNKSWEIALERYVALNPIVSIVGELVRVYYSNGAFKVRMTFI